MNALAMAHACTASGTLFGVRCLGLMNGRTQRTRDVAFFLQIRGWRGLQIRSVAFSFVLSFACGVARNGRDRMEFEAVGVGMAMGVCTTAQLLPYTAATLYSSWPAHTTSTPTAPVQVLAIVSPITSAKCTTAHEPEIRPATGSVQYTYSTQHCIKDLKKPSRKSRTSSWETQSNPSWETPILRVRFSPSHSHLSVSLAVQHCTCQLIYNNVICIKHIPVL